ncbi:SGNH hydrolase-type esterase domain-containing protein [Neocallimastix sp. 'constans']
MRSITIATILATTLLKTFAAPDPNFHIYLAFGQSNMEGQGAIEGQDKTVDKRFQMISTVSGCNGHQAGQWYDAVPPLANCDGKLGPVDYFGRAMVKALPEQIKVGVAVVAIAGCSIQLFEKDKYQSYQAESYMTGRINAYGGNPYGRLVEIGKKAQEDGVIKGILLHQGETNTGDSSWPSRVKGIYENLLKDLGLNANDVPLLAGEVVQSSEGGQCGSMNSIIDSLPQTIPTAHVISSQGLGQQGDGLHFTSAAYRTFGERYAKEMLGLIGNVSSAPANNNTNAPAGNIPADNSQETNTPAPEGNAPGQDNSQGNPWGQPQGNPWDQGNNNQGQQQGNPWDQGNNNQGQQQGNPWDQGNNNQGNPWGQPQWNQWGQQQGQQQGNPWDQGNNNQGNPWGQGGFNWAAPANNAAAPAAGNGGNCASLWAQCGGQGFNGASCCSEGTCKVVNEYFYQCQN